MLVLDYLDTIFLGSPLFLFIQFYSLVETLQLYTLASPLHHSSQCNGLKLQLSIKVNSPNVLAIIDYVC